MLIISLGIFFPPVFFFFFFFYPSSMGSCGLHHLFRLFHGLLLFFFLIEVPLFLGGGLGALLWLVGFLSCIIWTNTAIGSCRLMGLNVLFDRGYLEPRHIAFGFERSWVFPPEYSHDVDIGYYPHSNLLVSFKGMGLIEDIFISSFECRDVSPYSFFFHSEILLGLSSYSIYLVDRVVVSEIKG